MKVRLIAGIPETRKQGWQTSNIGKAYYTGKTFEVVDFHKVVDEAIGLSFKNGLRNFFHIADIRRISKGVKKPDAKTFDPSELNW
jgi:hypothetical protein